MNKPLVVTRPLAALASLAAVAALAALEPGCAAASDPNADETSTTGGDVEGASALTASGFTMPSLSPDERAEVLAKYDHVDPDHVIAKSLLDTTLVAFDVNRDKLGNTRYVTIVDFSLRSNKQRLFVVDLTTGAVEGHVVAHGSGSDPGDTGYAKRFSNVVNSNASSLGFYATGEIYSGKHGRSLRLDGLSPTNTKVRARDVVIHGASYVREGSAKQGLSSGCLALPTNAKDAIITKLAGESLLYAGLPSD
jgi:hypothetical protein